MRGQTQAAHFFVCDPAHAHAAVFETHWSCQRRIGRGLAPIDLKERVMKMQNLLLGLFIAVAQGVTVPVLADEFEVLVPIKAGVSPPNAIAEIKVDGTSKKYTDVKNKKLQYIIAVRGDRPKKAQNGGLFDISLGDGEVYGQISSLWRYYELSASYEDPLSSEYPGLRVSPVELCNERLQQTSGQARKAFRKDGETFAIQEAYPMTGSITWAIRNVLLSDLKTFGDRAFAPVKITCMPLARHDPDPNAPSRTTPPPKPSRTTPPLFSKTTFEIEPAKIVKDGKYLCPSELRLYGYIEANGAFEGKSIFMGPHYLSAVSELDLSKASSRNVIGTYPIKWHQLGGLAAQANTKPADQKLAFRFNISDAGGKLVKSMEKTVTVNCSKIKPNDAAVGDEMAVTPAN
jgi:hypothetical protein